MITKIAFAVLVSLLLAAPPARAQFTASEGLKTAVEQSINNANANISSFVGANNVLGAVFWYADDAQIAVQNLTLTKSQASTLVELGLSFLGTFGQNQTSNLTANGQSVETGNIVVLSNQFVLEFAARYASPIGNGLLMRIWRFQTAGGEPATLSQDFTSADQIRAAGVFRIWRETYTGPVGEQDAFNQILQQLPQLLSQVQ